jgi:hypothetical protein
MSVVMLKATLMAPKVLIVEASQQVPLMVGSHCIARSVHWRTIVWSWKVSFDYFSDWFSYKEAPDSVYRHEDCSPLALPLHVQADLKGH